MSTAEPPHPDRFSDAIERLLLCVARRADALASGPAASPETARRLWLRAEHEVFASDEPLRCAGAATPPFRRRASRAD